jgi:hypothetical protein
MVAPDLSRSIFPLKQLKTRCPEIILGAISYYDKAFAIDPSNKYVLINKSMVLKLLNSETRPQPPPSGGSNGRIHVQTRLKFFEDGFYGLYDNILSIVKNTRINMA